MATENDELNTERETTLPEWEEWLEIPMLILGLAWVVLLVFELTRGLSPILVTVSTIIWAIFLVDFLVRFALAPRKGTYLKRNWLTALSLVIPALRIFRVVRVLQVLRAARGLRLVKVLGSVNRGMRALRRTMGRRGLPYVVALTAIVIVAGAAGMYALEPARPGTPGLSSFGSAVWWTAMIMTTMGSDYWPRTGEARLLCVLLSLYAFTVFGYITASLASFFVDRDAERDDAEVAGRKELVALKSEIQSLRQEIRELVQPRPAGESPPRTPVPPGGGRVGG